ncbi:hypothetical protein BRD00_11140 [Halobacteriales archaeon QS_8_69_26]|nr:MAG: hypothetical protein BRD00_11140 [Halobacteriales archaeon QS_8_69_26]
MTVVFAFDRDWSDDDDGDGEVTVVCAFDRDWTVDINPHPSKEAVPLTWVRYLAHETDHPVYAIGNQDLAEEAAIPGVVDVVGRHPDDWDRWLGEKQADGRYERFPERRERLALIADLHPDADAYVVVDDLDLSDVEGWDHYHPWDFVPAVERGEIDPDLPWVRDPVADGGIPTTAGIIPSDPSSLVSFLGEYPDGPGYELTYVEDDDQRTELCWDVSPIQRSLDRPAAAPTIRCVPMDLDREAFTLRMDAVDRLSVVEPPRDLHTAGAETPAEEAEGLRRLASNRPEAVRVSAVLSLLDRTDPAPREDALEALAEIAAARPGDCTPAIPILRSLLEEGDLAEAGPVLRTLRAIAEERPGDIAPLVDLVVPYLTGGEGPERVAATWWVMEVAEDDPDDVVEAIPALADVLGNEGPGQAAAVYALSCISRE